MLPEADRGPENQDNLDPEPSEGEETSSEATDYEAQYKELRSKFNERDEEISSLRARTALLDELGIDMDELARAYYSQEEEPEEEPEQTDEYQDPGELALQRLQRLEEQQQERETQAQQRAEQEAFDEQILNDLEDLEEDQEIEFSDHTVAVFQAMAYQGVPPQETFKVLQTIYGEGATWQAKQAERKRSAAKPPKGGPGSREENLDTSDKRRDALEREIEQAMGSAD